jgi:arsenate reductase (thioredoxin)
MGYPIRVLFLCAHNAARSQMAEGLLRFFGQGDFEVYSAGSEPRGIHPLAARTMQEIGVSIVQQRSKHIDELLDQQFDYVISLCEEARDVCPEFPKDEMRIQWRYPDPSAVKGDEEARYRAFRKTVIELRERIRLWVLAQRKSLREQGVALASEQY